MVMLLESNKQLPSEIKERNILQTSLNTYTKFLKASNNS